MPEILDFILQQSRASSADGCSSFFFFFFWLGLHIHPFPKMTTHPIDILGKGHMTSSQNRIFCCSNIPANNRTEKVF